MLDMSNDVIMKRLLGNGSLEHDRKHVMDKLHNWEYFSTEVKEHYSTADIRVNKKYFKLHFLVYI